MDLISIVVPVYNVEKYLNKCINSLVKQTYKNIEILLIDDGSKDGSLKLCNYYKKNDDRIKVFHKKNGGLSSARNYGIEKAKGKYICFVDSDDFVSEDLCTVLYNSILKYNADVSIGRVVDCYNTIPKVDNSKCNDILLSNEEAIKMVMEAREISVHAVAKLYRKDLFSKQLRFEEGKIAEDAIIMIELLSKCKKVMYNSSFIYYYIHRKNSITTRHFNQKNYDVLYAYKKNKKIIMREFPNLADVAEMRICWANFNVLDNMIRCNEKVDKQIVKYLRGKIKFILKNDCFTKSRKIAIIVLKISVYMYRIVVKLFYSEKRKTFD